MIKVINNANIIDGISDEVIAGGYLVFDRDSGAILEVGQGTGGGKAAAANILDLQGAWVMPGLINCHVHLCRDGSADPDRLIRGENMETVALRTLRNAQNHLRLGITTVRDTGSPGNTALAVRNVIAAGLFPGPRIVAAGQPIMMTGGHFHALGKEVDGADEVRKRARELLKAGADFVKVMATGGIYSPGEDPGSSQLTLAEIEAAVEEAHKKNRRAVAHADGLEGILHSLIAGVDTIEHGIYADEQALAMMAEQGTYLVPTIIAIKRIAEAESGIPPYAVVKAREVAADHLAMLRRAIKAGVKIATGSDAGSPCNPPEEYFAELKIMQQAGMNTMQVIKAATATAAAALGLADVGSLAPGKQADLLVVAANPLEDLANLRQIKHVFRRGIAV